MSERIAIGELAGGIAGLPLTAALADHSHFEPQAYDERGTIPSPREGQIRFVQHKDHFSMEQYLDEGWEEVPCVVRLQRPSAS